MKPDVQKVECEFTLALNNRTGKYLFCKELIEETPDLVKSVRYWRLATKEQPRGFFARVLGKCAQLEVAFRFNYPRSYKYVPAISLNSPVVFTDPRECVLYRMHPWDVVICHDMGPMTHRELYHPGVFRLYQSAFKRIAAAKPHMVFVSEATRDEFVRLYGEDFPCLRVVHIPLRQAMEAGDTRVVEGLPDRFLLTVGAVGTRKNQIRSIEAFGLSRLAEEGCGYVLCGGPEPGYDAVVQAAQKVAGVVLLGHVQDSQLRWLYGQAQGFVLTSLLEGFGLPAAEAIRFGLVPLISAGGALQEVSGDQAILVDPLKIEEIALGMRKLLDMEEGERGRRIAALRAHAAQFSKTNTMTAWRETLAASLYAANNIQGTTVGKIASA